MGINVKFNWEKADKKLKKSIKVKNKAVNDEVEKAIKKGAIMVSNDAKIFAPVDTGELRRSIGFKKASGSGVDVVFEVFANAPHAVHVEFGTHKQKANPFFRRAFFKNRSKINSMIKRAVNRGLGK